MFLLNLSVGLVVDKYMGEKRKSKQGSPARTDTQNKWIKHRWDYMPGRTFQLTDLHTLTLARRCLYDFVSTEASENTILIMILSMTLCMAIQVFRDRMAPRDTYGPPALLSIASTPSSSYLRQS